MVYSLLLSVDLLLPSVEAICISLLNGLASFGKIRELGNSQKRLKELNGACLEADVANY